MGRQPAKPPRGQHQVPNLRAKIGLYLRALLRVPLYRLGELGNLLYAIGKNMMEGVVLYTMFTMAENELKIAAVLGVAVKYAYPGISVISSNYTSEFIDQIESSPRPETQISRLIKAQAAVGGGQALGGLLLFCCFPPLFKRLFYGLPHSGYILVALYLLHHVFDGSAQILEGRTWFKIIELTLRRNPKMDLSANFWVIYALSQNVQLLLGQFFLWGSLLLTSHYSTRLTSTPIMGAAVLGLVLVTVAKFILPAAYYYNHHNLRRRPL
ncbi:MAG: hypothetical protein JRJ56_06855 [Deltaproteobacteria bacterium]|nr:hypothetical protein [Deltaproteobacteria bacterium]